MTDFILKFLLWSMISYGISSIIVESILFRWIRNTVKSRFEMLHSLITCLLCTGVWVGFLMSVNVWSPSGEVFKYQHPYYIQVFIDGILSSQIVWFIAMVERYYSEKMLSSRSKV